MEVKLRHRQSLGFSVRRTVSEVETFAETLVAVVKKAQVAEVDLHPSRPG